MSIADVSILLGSRSQNTACTLVMTGMVIIDKAIAMVPSVA